ncbi:hypothetical protein MJG50_20655 [Fredinandcohnia sp. SECRCQ15]|uniref:Uncharacterized protein n=2 Tax=Fredinandcohnia quinoae TaxID=2918902 RepID=A0AAW5E483_9BACI|nr:hypothetical protein [Fredinandcohnia sp. SECRCQ15]
MVAIGSYSKNINKGDLLFFGDDQMNICAERSAGVNITVGELFRNQGDMEITITKVNLVEANGMRKLDAVLVEHVPEELLMGLRDGWPPNDELFPLPEKWDSRVKAEGAVIEPGEEWSLVIGLVSYSAETAFTKVKIVYKDKAGKFYEQIIPMKYYITSNCKKAMEEY